MMSRYSRLWVCVLLVGASAAMYACTDRLPTEQGAGISWKWPDGISATGSDPCGGYLSNPPPECCYKDPSLPGCMPEQCFSQQDYLAAEYRDPTFQNTLRPSCHDFKSSGGSQNFSWAELNDNWSQGSGHYPWGMIKGSLLTGLEETRTRYNRGGIKLTSGYRCPHGNATITGAAMNSKHTHGTGVDMYSADHGGRNWSLEECALLRTAALAAGATEAFSCTRYDDRHLHAEWDFGDFT